MKIIEHCGICRSTSLDELWDLPALPLTERFGPYDPAACPPIDQKLLFCAECGHIQLGHQVSPALLYGSHYAFRTSASDSARAGSDFFLHFFNKVKPKQKFRSLADIGGNDLYLAKNMALDAANRSVIDPVCKSIDGKTVDGITVHGKMIESVDLSRDLEAPDLIVTRHTLEHIADPLSFLRQLFDQCAEDCFYLFEIPCLERLADGMRFDAIFHQHYHYYDLTSFKRLLKEVGGEYLDHAYNYQGSCGGALLVAFRKAKSRSDEMKTGVQNRQDYFRKKIRLYQNEMEIMASHLNGMQGKIYGYGASLMLATLAYHLKSDLSCLEFVLDDARDKDGFTYENLPVKVKYPQNGIPEPEANYLITSLENARPIFKRLLNFKPRRILMPLLA